MDAMAPISPRCCRSGSLSRRAHRANACTRTGRVQKIARRCPSAQLVCNRMYLYRNTRDARPRRLFRNAFNGLRAQLPTEPYLVAAP
jgi:hypothetical protein